MKLGGEVDSFAIGGDNHFTGLLIETAGQFDRFAGCPVITHYPPAVRLERGSSLGTIDQVFTVRRVDRSCVVPVICDRYVLLRFVRHAAGFNGERRTG